MNIPLYVEYPPEQPRIVSPPNHADFCWQILCSMSLQEKMFSEVENWMASGAAKLAFLAGKDYSVAKFNYWLAKWKASQGNETTAGFMEIGFEGSKVG